MERSKKTARKSSFFKPKRSAPKPPPSPPLKRTAVDTMQSGTRKKAFIPLCDQDGPDADEVLSEVIGVYANKNFVFAGAYAWERAEIDWGDLLDDDENAEGMKEMDDVVVIDDPDECLDDGTIFRFKDNDRNSAHLYLSSAGMDEEHIEACSARDEEGGESGGEAGGEGGDETGGDDGEQAGVAAQRTDRDEAGREIGVEPGRTDGDETGKVDRDDGAYYSFRKR